MLKFSPASRVSRKADQCLKALPASLFCSEPTFRKGLSLASGDFLFPGCRLKVNAPGCFLQHHAEPFIEPVPLTAPPLSSVCPVLGGIVAMSPLPDFVPALLAATVSPLPLGDCYIPLRIAAFDAACRSKAHLF